MFETSRTKTQTLSESCKGLTLDTDAGRMKVYFNADYDSLDVRTGCCALPLDGAERAVPSI